MKIETVVVGVDFRGAGLAGARWAARQLAPARIRLVHAVHLPQPPKFLAGLYGDEEQLVVSARAGARARLEEFSEQLERDTGVSVDGEVRIGRPAEQIAEVVDSLDASLVIVGRESGRRGRWSLLGSTAARVVHDARVPTLLSVGAMDGPPHRILAPIDESAVAAGVLRWSHDWAEHFDASLFILHVLEYPLPAHLRAITPPERSSEGELQIELKAREWLVRRVDEAGVPISEDRARVAIGDPVFEILATAERRRTDLIVMGSRGAGTLGRAFMGSVADGVLRAASCPVLVIPGG